MQTPEAYSSCGLTCYERSEQSTSVSRVETFEDYRLALNPFSVSLNNIYIKEQKIFSNNKKQNIKSSLFS